jgi:hypothetical protein
MKKIILAFVLAGSTFISKAQKEQLVTPYAVPVDSVSELITYEKVVEVKGVSEEELYKRINDWFHTFYKNPSEAIRENDSVNHTIVGKPRFRLSNTAEKDGMKTEAGLVQYTITVSSRNGRFKYEITAFNVKQASYFPCEKWLDTKAISYMPAYNDYLQQLDKYAHELTASLINAASHAKPVKDKDAW